MTLPVVQSIYRPRVRRGVPGKEWTTRGSKNKSIQQPQQKERHSTNDLCDPLIFFATVI
jgi:hypothetical protein